MLALKALTMLPIVVIVGGCARCEHPCCAVGATAEGEALTSQREIGPGMSAVEVRNLLGEPNDIDGYGAGYYDWTYFEVGLVVSFDNEGLVIATRRIKPRPTRPKDN